MLRDNVCYIFFSLFAWSFCNSGAAQSLPAGGMTGVNAKDLFSKDSVLAVTLRGDIRDLLNDRGEDPQYHDMIVSYADEKGAAINISARIKTRGHFRKLRGNCEYPPLLLNFSKSDTLAASIFKDQDKLKLVMPCQGDEYVIKEYLVYKIYNLITPVSFRARLVNITLADDDKKNTKSFYGFFLEEEAQMARRNGLFPIELKIRRQQTQAGAFITMALFEYLIANTDWSVEYLQNIKLVTVDSNTVPITVPYDFDHSGIVYSPYAKPAEELQMRSVRERRYRGYCIENMNAYDSAVAKFNNLKQDIYNVYRNCILLTPKYLKSTIAFLDEFYQTINDPDQLTKELRYPCDPNGTGNVIIRGLKED